MGSKKIGQKSPGNKFREMVKAVDVPKGVWCPICEDYIVTPDEMINPLEEIEDMVFDHYKAFHTAEEIEKHVGGKND